VATRKKPVKKVVKKVARSRKTTKEPVLTKLDFWAIATKEVYDSLRKAGMDEGTALAFAMDRSSYPDWIVDPLDPIKNPLDDFDEDEE
jgi:predicted metal-dependent phosphotriesterase family hydrolase